MKRQHDAAILEEIAEYENLLKGADGEEQTKFLTDKIALLKQKLKPVRKPRVKKQQPSAEEIEKKFNDRRQKYLSSKTG